ncbi:MAG: hypothetical protein U1F43_26145 [Myxococcota bacterium]
MEPRLPASTARLALAALVLCTTLSTACEDQAAVPFGVDTVGSSDGVSASGDVVVLTRADIVKLAGVRHIEGDLEIRMTTAVALPDLETIGGSLRLAGTAATEVTPDVSLPALERIGLDLAVAYTKDSGRLQLPSLTEVGRHVALTHGTWDVDLGALKTIGGDLRVNDASLVGIDLGKLASVGGAMRILRFGLARGTVVSVALPSLREVTGDVELAQGADLDFSAPLLATIGRDLDVSGLAVSLSLPGLTRLGDDLLVDDVTMTALDLSHLATVEGEIAIDGARGDGLADLELGALHTVVGSLTLRDVANLGRASLPALVDLGGALDLEQVPSLARLELAALTHTNGDLIVRQAGNVLVLAQVLASVGGDLRIEDCGRMQANLPALTSIVGSLSIRGGTLVDPGVPKLATVGRDLVLQDLSVELDTLTFAALTSVSGTLRAAQTIYLDRLRLPLVTQVGSVQGGFPIGDLDVRENFALIELGLPLLASVARDVAVRDNPRLPVADVTAALAGITVGGSTTVCGNDGGDACPP